MNHTFQRALHCCKHKILKSLWCKISVSLTSLHFQFHSILCAQREKSVLIPRATKLFSFQCYKALEAASIKQKSVSCPWTSKSNCLSYAANTQLMWYAMFTLQRKVSNTLEQNVTIHAQCTTNSHPFCVEYFRSHTFLKAFQS